MTFEQSQYHFWISSECESAHKEDFFDTTHAFSEQKLAHFVHWGEADPTLSLSCNFVTGLQFSRFVGMVYSPQ